MTEQVGSIEYNVSAETSGLLKAEKATGKSTSAMAGSFKKIDEANKKTANEIKKTTSAVDNALKEQARAAERAAKAAERAAERKSVYAERAAERAKIAAEKAAESEVRNAKKAAAAVAAAAKKASEARIAAENKAASATVSANKRAAQVEQKRVAGFSRATGQASIQVQQLFGQIQGGQDPLNAFAAQIADIGIVTGFAFAGAIAGIAASLGGVLLPSLFDSKTATEKLEKAMESLNKIASDSDGIKVFSQDIADLAKVSESAARLVLIAAEQTSKEAGRAAAEGIGEAFNDSFDVTFFQKSFDSLKSIAGTAGGTGYSISKEYEELGERFGLTGKAARDAGTSVLISLRDMELAVSSNAPDAGEKIVAFQEKLAELSTTAKGENRTKLLTFVSSISDYIKKAKEASEISKALSDALKDNGLDLTTEKTKKHVEESDRLVSSINAQIIALEEGEEAAFRFATAQQLGLEVGEQIPENIDNQISALFKLKKAQDDARIAKQEADKADREKKSLTSRVSSIGLSPEDALADRFAKEAELLRSAKEQEILTESEFLARKLELNNQHEKALKDLRDKAAKDSLINFQALQDQAIGTFASIALGAQDGEEAIKGLAKSVLTQLIGSLIKYGAQYAIEKGAELLLNTTTDTAKAASSVTATTAITAAGVASAATLAAAWAPAAALSSLASFGANAAPASAGIAATFGLAEGLALAGGRQYGGPVNNGSMYRVGEDGPEVFSSGGKNFMIPGENGKVIPNNEINNNTTSQNNISLTLNIDPRSPDEFSDQLVRNAPLLTNLVEKAINDRGRTL